MASNLSQDNILNAVNKERSLRNLVLLNHNNKLSAAAQSKSDDMQSRHYFAHIDPDGHYIWDKIVAAGYTPYVQLGENLAIEFYDTESLMSAWMNSPTHRANIIQEGFKDQGMGLTFGDSQNGQYYSAITNTFGAQDKPKAQSPSPAPTAQKPVPKPVPPKIVPPKPVAQEPVVQAKPVEDTPVKNLPVINKEPAPAETKFPPVSPRQEKDLAINEPNFTLQHTIPTTSSSSASTNTTESALKENFSALVGQAQNQGMDNNDANRYLILICGVALLLLMLSDLKSAIEKKLGSLDKKINNLAVLLIAIIVIAFMYWF